MTITIKEAVINDICISIENEKFSKAFKVTACRRQGDMFGYPTKENYYPTIDKANRRFNDLRRAAEKGELT